MPLKYPRRTQCYCVVGPAGPVFRAPPPGMPGMMPPPGDKLPPGMAMPGAMVSKSI